MGVRGGAARLLARLMLWRSQVQILLPPPTEPPRQARSLGGSTASTSWPVATVGLFLPETWVRTHLDVAEPPRGANHREALTCGEPKVTPSYDSAVGEH